MTADPSMLTPDELDTFIKTRLVLSGIDLNLLPTSPDPVTGAPTQNQVLASLRSFVTSSPVQINAWRPIAKSTPLSQELSPPLEYPSISEAWTGRMAEK
ncbi:MAG TPA: hypothetical protein VGH11_00130 [Jatrophihabitans sp.]